VTSTITICCPTTRVPNRSMRTLLGAALDAGYPVEVLGESPVDRCRGMLAGRALTHGTPWLGWVDDDQVGTLDQMLGLMRLGEEIGADLVTGVYVCRHEAERVQRGEVKRTTPPLNITPLDSGTITLGEGGGPLAIAHCGFGFLAVRWSVFDRIEAPPCTYGRAWFLPLVAGGFHFGEDRSFGIRARAAGCNLIADTRVMIGHEGGGVYWPLSHLWVGP
jgi:hypothetical protein